MNLCEVFAADTTPHKTEAGAWEPVPALKPTEAMPGSREKLEVLKARFLRGEELHHPEDRKAGDET